MIETLYIPTMGRTDIQITYDNLPYKYQKMVKFVIPKKEWKLMTKKYGDNQLLVTPSKVKGIAATREFICRHAGETRFSMIDDDVIFYRRNQKYYSDLDNKSNMDKSKRQMTEQDFDDMFEMFDRWMDEGYLHVGHRRANLPPCKKSHDDICFFNSIHHIDGKKLSNIIDGIDWTFCEVGEDANFMFEYLSRGFINRKSCEFSAHWDSFQDGGCAVYRDSEFHNKEHGKLQKRGSNDLVKVRAEITGQGTHGHNIGTIKEFTYKPKLMRKLWLQEHGLKTDVLVHRPKEIFDKELGEKLK